jgi:very-short-patch-repair endonuclease
LLSSDPEKLQKWFLQAIESTKDFDELQNYDEFASKLDPIETSIFRACKLLLVNIEDWSTAIQQYVFLQWIESIEKKNPQLRGNPFEKYVKLRDRLQELVQKKSGLVSAKVSEDIFRKASGARQLARTFSGPGQLGLDWKKFDHELTKTRRVKPMRKLFEAYESLVKLIAPCWLVSPEMLSRVIPLEREFFDLVIFDEASQLSVENSLPALYRAKRVVIAGDEKQLQPFDLFNILNSDEDENEEESDEITRAESLLMLAKRTFHFRYLSWHYRSESQELIDFSNYAFYKGQLSIAGNVNRKSTKPAIHWMNCNGTWNDRSNIPEAEIVVDQISDILSQESTSKESPSIGVVTFNDAQRDQILTSITSRTERDPVFSEFYSRSEAIAKTRPDKKLFVKNIENVQGDERDVIIFSIGYAKDPFGNFSIRFGSLNREGGENRLNVAVTRARKEIIVCCSFDPVELPVERSKHEGPKLLKDYLLYAKAVSEGNSTAVKDILTKLAQQSFDRKIIESSKDNVFESPLEEEVYNGLSALGYTIDTQVGFSAYKIDLGVVHPKNPNKYVLAIECDGATFHSAKSSRERDLVRQRYLESRGWKVERIWSRNWWRNQDGELQRLHERIEKESLGDPPLIKK